MPADVGLRGFFGALRAGAGRPTETGFTPQISLAYSRMVRSDEKRPMAATLAMDMRVQCSWSRQIRETRSWALE